MKLLLFIFLVSFSITVNAQPNFLNGTWQGLKLNMGQPNEKSKAIWFDLIIDTESKIVTGNARIETPFTEYFAIKKLKGKLISDTEIEFEDIMIGNKKNSGRAYWCLLKGNLTYNKINGYLAGNFTSPDCRSNVGKITLYKSKHKMSMTDTVSLYHTWVNNMVNDLNRGWKAYYVRDAEMKNFEFKPVYFDHDKDILKDQYYSFLKQMVKIVQSHTDLRIKIIGHTDSNGTDAYNVNLSERRAETIQSYLMTLGIKSDKIVIEYRGENDPAVSNSTSKGKQLNRRVDFEFI